MVYLYPLKDQQTGEITNSDNLILSPRMKELYKFFKHNEKVKDITTYNPDYMNIFSREVLQHIKDRTPGWENSVPKEIPEIIKNKGLFSYKEVSINDF